ncbi:MAG: protealysin inhibitor emfourin [Candidatus Methanoperedens sp.]
MEKIEANKPTKPLEGNMLFYLERTGGIAELRMTVTLNTESLPPEDAHNLQQMVEVNQLNIPENLQPLMVNETFLLKLGADYDWNITIDDQKIISRIPNVAVIVGAQGIYKAHKEVVVTK